MADRNDKKGFDVDFLDLPQLPAKPGKTSVSEKAAMEDTGSAGDLLDEQGRIDNTIDSLFQKMRKKGDFPSFSKQIVDVNKILKLKYASAKDIADVIMKDFSLSNKLLKLVNSSFYGQFSKDGISSVSSAMIILGAEQVQQAAASLMLFEHMQSNSQSDELKDITISTFLSGLIAKDIATLKHYADTEEFLICAMFHNLGENLIVFYFPEKYRRINRLAENQGVTKNAASKQVLGITYKELGVGIAKKWGLPNNIVLSMEPQQPVGNTPVTREATRPALLGTVATFSNELCDIQKNPDSTKRTEATQKLITKFDGRAVIDLEEVDGLIRRVAEKIKQHSTHLNINVKNSLILSNLAGGSGKTKKNKTTPKKDKNSLAKKTKEIQNNINIEIDKLNKKLKTSFSMSEVLTTILDVMHREFEFSRVAICIKDVAKNSLEVRYGLGKNIESFTKDFHFSITRSNDIFHRALSRETDYIVKDVNDPRYKVIIPEWYQKLKLSAGFDLYTIVVNHVTIGFFYADRESSSELSSPELQVSMKRLRNIAEKAIRLKKLNG